MKITSLEELKQEFPVTVKVPLAWGEMDAMQHVNHTVYLRWMETARFSYFDRLRLMQGMQESGIGVILKSIDCRYRLPLTYPDTVNVGVKIYGIEESEFQMRHVVFSDNYHKTAAEASATLVVYDYRRQIKAPVPESLLEKIRKLEGTLEGMGK